MTRSGKILVTLAMVLASIGGPVGLCAERSGTGTPASALSLVARVEMAHAPAHLPAKSRPCVLCLGENGIDEEDNERLDTLAAYVPPGAWARFGQLNPAFFTPAPDRAIPGGVLAVRVMRC